MRRKTAIATGLLAGGAAIVLAAETDVGSRVRDTLAGTTSQAQTASEPEMTLVAENTAGDTIVDATTPGAGAELEQMRADLNARDAEVEQLSAQIAEQQVEISTLRVDLADRDAQLQSVQAALAQSEADFTQLQGKFKILRQGDEFEPQRVALLSPQVEGTDDLDTLRGGSVDLEAALETAKAPRMSAALSSEKPIREVHFETASAELTTGGRQRAIEAAQTVAALDLGKIRVSGHTDRTGDAEFNRRLSAARAEAVTEVLIEAGLTRDQIEIVPMGETPDVLPISTPDGVAEPLNRCVGIFPVLDTAETAAN